VQDFKKLKVWQKSRALSLEVYRLTAAFPKEEVYGLTGQMRRAALSIGANIAEGCGRFTDGDLVRFLDIAMGSTSELEHFELIARDLESLGAQACETLDRQVIEVRRMLRLLILKIRQKRPQPADH
jgi:four helix bundle protein